MIKKFLKYGVAGGTAFLLDFLVLFLLLSFTKLHFAIAIIIGFVFGTLLNYTINRLYVFRDSSQKIVKGYFYFLIIAIVGVSLTILFVFLLKEFTSLSILWARVVAAGLVYIWSFISNQMFNFKA